LGSDGISKKVTTYARHAAVQNDAPLDVVRGKNLLAQKPDNGAQDNADVDAHVRERHEPPADFRGRDLGDVDGPDDEAAADAQALVRLLGWG
jgi:hypothetical protein